MTINIRLAYHRDAPILAQRVMTVQYVHRQVEPERYKPLRADDPELITYYEGAIAQDGNYIFIAEIDNQAVGHVSCQVRQLPDNLFTYGLLNLHIDQMTVDEAYQSQGVGKALMNRAIEQGKALNVERVSLGVIAFNKRAIRFYEQFGFEFWSYRMAIMLGDLAN